MEGKHNKGGAGATRDMKNTDSPSRGTLLPRLAARPAKDFSLRRAEHAWHTKNRGGSKPAAIITPARRRTYLLSMLLNTSN